MKIINPFLLKTLSILSFPDAYPATYAKEKKKKLRKD